MKRELRRLLFQMHKDIAFMYYIGAIKLIEVERNSPVSYEIRFDMKLRQWHPFSLILILLSAVNCRLKFFKDVLEAREVKHITTLGKYLKK